MSGRKIFRIAGWLAVASSAFWLITGMGWWAPLYDPNHNFNEFARGFLLTIVHGALLVMLFVSYDDKAWK